MEMEVQASLINQFEFIKYTDNIPANIAVIREIIKNIQINGYSIGDGELVPDTVAIAVPIFYSYSQRVNASLRFIGLKEDFNGNYSYYIEELKRASKQISEKITTSI